MRTSEQVASGTYCLKFSMPPSATRKPSKAAERAAGARWRCSVRWLGFWRGMVFGCMKALTEHSQSNTTVTRKVDMFVPLLCLDLVSSMPVETSKQTTIITPPCKIGTSFRRCVRLFCGVAHSGFFLESRVAWRAWSYSPSTRVPVASWLIQNNKITTR